MKVPFLNANKRQQHTLTFTEDQRIVVDTMPIEKGYMVSEDTYEAWHLVSQLLLPKKGSDHLYQLISERDAVPLNPFGITGLEKLTDAKPIAREEFYRSLKEMEKDNKKNKLASALTFAILSMVAFFGIVVVVMLMK